MPIRRKCPKSGAIIYDLTPEEQSVQDLKKELEEMKKDMDDKLKQLDRVLKQTKKKGD